MKQFLASPLTMLDAYIADQEILLNSCQAMSQYQSRAMRLGCLPAPATVTLIIALSLCLAIILLDSFSYLNMSHCAY